MQTHKTLLLKVEMGRRMMGSKSSRVPLRTETAEAPEDLEEGPPREVQTPEEIQTEAKVCAPCLILKQTIQSTVHTYLVEHDEKT